MEKRPRQYAADFIKAGDCKAKQQAALVGCPEEYRELVKTHIRIERELSKYKEVKHDNRINQNRA